MPNPEDARRPVSPEPEEQQLLAALRAGDEEAFMALVERYHAAMIRLAATYVGSQAAAEDVTQETWVRALRSLAQFEGRSSLKTWLFRILTNTAITHAKRDGRTIPFSDLEHPSSNDDEPAVEPERFLPVPGGGGQWAVDPAAWRAETLENQVTRRELLTRIQAAIDALPPTQRAVITLHDVEGWGSKDICNILDITETNQRVLLHRARSKVRRAVERYLDSEMDMTR